MVYGFLVISRNQNFLECPNAYLAGQNTDAIDFG
ncbi:hypothetical protein BDA96_06G188300 [Sorghum bicolor]|uniref:Uncharacterized protein n=1 Tax=Sorghum bicolor TaxID=4558 RepID=A0A921QTT1_SORBI|nr:hypothetical protein BDA96_06G188300 [Sorghum bicolor]